MTCGNPQKKRGDRSAAPFVTAWVAARLLLFLVFLTTATTAVRVRVGLGVVLVVVDLTAFLVLLMFDLVVLGARQVAAILLTIGFRLVVNLGFVVFDVPGFTR